MNAMFRALKTNVRTLVVNAMVRALVSAMLRALEKRFGWRSGNYVSILKKNVCALENYARTSEKVNVAISINTNMKNGSEH